MPDVLSCRPAGEVLVLSAHRFILIVGVDAEDFQEVENTSAGGTSGGRARPSARSPQQRALPARLPPASGREALRPGAALFPGVGRFGSEKTRFAQEFLFGRRSRPQVDSRVQIAQSAANLRPSTARATRRRPCRPARAAGRDEKFPAEDGAIRLNKMEGLPRELMASSVEEFILDRAGQMSRWTARPSSAVVLCAQAWS